MPYVFSGCSSLVEAPEIPSGVTSMLETFKGCSSLKTAPEIPSKVTNMNSTFENCESLKGEVNLCANPTDISGIFCGVAQKGDSLVVNYTKENESVIDKIIAEKDKASDIRKGKCLNGDGTERPEEIKISSIKLSKSALTLSIGETNTLQTIIAPEDATNKNVIWKSSDTKVVTVNADGTVEAVGIGSAVITCTAQDGSGEKATCRVTVNPAEPKLKKVLSSRYDSVTVSWDKVADVTGYIIYQKNGSRWTRAGSVDSKTTSFTKTGLTCGKNYTFTVKAYKKVGKSVYNSKYDKNGITGKPMLSAPSIRNLKAYRTSIKMTWRTVADASGYIVYRKTGSNRWERVAVIKGGSQKGYTDKKVENGKEYTYTVKAYKVVNEKNVYSSYDKKGRSVKK